MHQSRTITINPAHCLCCGVERTRCDCRTAARMRRAAAEEEVVANWYAGPREGLGMPRMDFSPKADDDAPAVNARGSEAPGTSGSSSADADGRERLRLPGMDWTVRR